MRRGITYGMGAGKDCPCHGCEDRHAVCHGECEKFKVWDEKRKAEKLERYKRTSLLHEADRRKKEAVERYRRRGKQV